MTACALRCFLRYAHDAGLVAADLSAAVPAVPSRRAGLPRALTGEQVSLLLGACNRSTPVGLRDYAVIVCLARLGLRAGEVGGLALSAIDWPAGVVTVCGKGGRVDQLPIPVDVGAAIVAYLRHGRPRTSSLTVFVRACAPFTPLGASSVSCIVGRVAARAGLGTVHAHRLRHTAATATLNAGASLAEVSLLLRHASPATTTVYAKADLGRLTGIARPWPGGC
jgi:site-specific recombinase XerD